MQSPTTKSRSWVTGGVCSVPGAVLRAVRKLSGMHLNIGRLDIGGAEKVFLDAGYDAAAAKLAAQRMFESTAIGQSGTIDITQLAAYAPKEPKFHHCVKQLTNDDFELAECEKALRPVFCKYVAGDGRLDVSGFEKLIADPALMIPARARSEAVASVPELMVCLDTQKRGSLSISEFAEFVIEPDNFILPKAQSKSPKVPAKEAQHTAVSPLQKPKRMKLHSESTATGPASSSPSSTPSSALPHQQTAPTAPSGSATSAAPKPPRHPQSHLDQSLQKLVSPLTHRLIPQLATASSQPSPPPPSPASSSASSSSQPALTPSSPSAATGAAAVTEPAAANEPLPVPPLPITPQQVQAPATLVPTPTPPTASTSHPHEPLAGTSFATLHGLQPAEFHPEARVHEPLQRQTPASRPHEHPQSEAAATDTSAGADSKHKETTQPTTQPTAQSTAPSDSALQLPRPKLAREVVPPAPSPSPSASPAATLMPDRPDRPDRPDAPKDTPKDATKPATKDAPTTPPSPQPRSQAQTASLAVAQKKRKPTSSEATTSSAASSSAAGSSSESAEAAAGPSVSSSSSSSHASASTTALGGVRAVLEMGSALVCRALGVPTEPPHDREQQPEASPASTKEQSSQPPTAPQPAK